MRLASFVSRKKNKNKNKMLNTDYTSYLGIERDYLSRSSTDTGQISPQATGPGAPIFSTQLRHRPTTPPNTSLTYINLQASIQIRFGQNLSHRLNNIKQQNHGVAVSMETHDVHPNLAFGMAVRRGKSSPISYLSASLKVNRPRLSQTRELHELLGLSFRVFLAFKPMLF